MKFEIMLGMLFVLLSRGVTPAAYFAEKFGVSLRSIYRYADALSAAGYPVLCKRGPDGGLYVPDSFRLSAALFTEDELSAAVAALDRMQAETYSEAAEEVKQKLLALKRDLPRDYPVRSGYVVVDGAPWGDAYGFRKKLEVALRALEESRTVRIRYHDRDGNVTDREIEPHYLVYKQGLAYLYAFCRMRGQFRFFKMGRIEHATLLMNSFERRETPDFALATEFRESAKNIEIELSVDRSVRSDVEEWLGITNVYERQNGEIRAVALLPDDGALAASLLRFGPAVKVLSPRSLAEKIRGMLADLTALYARP